MKEDIRQLLLRKSKEYEKQSFIQSDPICLPRSFSKLQDIEITAFWVAMLSWGNRKSIINSGIRLIELMEGHPYDFIINHKPSERNRFADFKHRTFQPIDALYFLEFFQWFYKTQSDTLESAFLYDGIESADNVETALIRFNNLFFSLPNAPKRTQKHVSTPERKSSCKRLNMFLRWMVRSPKAGVDFGLWRNLSASQLVIPLDVHVQRTAIELGLIQEKSANWKTAVNLTNKLKEWMPEDPCSFDYGLFGLGLEYREKKKN